jgi:S-formylglutathione hydrolase FrmB
MITFIKTKGLIHILQKENNEHVTLKDVIDIFADIIGKKSGKAFDEGKVSWYSKMENPYHAGTQEYFDFHLGEQAILCKIAEDECL